jgi:2-oxoisovalerate dehydrogenase E2 component (dihydrolipoyl transacylase)
MSEEVFKLPDVGEGLTEAELLQWFVAVGDSITVNQVICEIETAKAVVELPSPFQGVVSELLVEAGQTANVGAPIIRVTTDREPTPDDEKKKPARQAVLVGYGVKESGEAVRRKRTPSGQSTPAVGSVLLQRHDGPVLAKPPVRRLAKDLGVDLRSVRPSGPEGLISRTDVEQAARGDNGAASSRSLSSPPFSSYDAEREERIPVKGVLKHMADAMVSSAFTAPHVTEWVDVDVSGMMSAIQRLRSDSEYESLRVSPLLFVVAAVRAAIAEFPRINSSWDESAQEVVVRKYANIGIATATPRGLLVPVLHDVAKLSLPDIARRLDELVESARAGKISPEAMAHGSFSITNVGVFGVDGGTPIIPPGQGAILAIGQIRDRPWVVDNEIVIRPICELTLSFDHRMIDGELGSKVLARIADHLRDPSAML